MGKTMILPDGSRFEVSYEETHSGLPLPRVSDARKLDELCLVLSRAVEISRERKAGKRPRRKSPVDAREEILRLSAAANEMRTKQPTDSEVERYLQMAQEVRK